MRKLCFTLWALSIQCVAWGGDMVLPLNNGWEFHQTNDITLPYTEIKANTWHAVTLDNYLNLNTKEGIYGWYRIQFDWPQTYNQDTLALYIDRIFKGDETYLNGTKIGGLGKILTPWMFATTLNPSGMPRNYTFNTTLLKPKNNTIAIKVNLGFGNEREAEFFGGIGIANQHIFLGEPSSVATVAADKTISNTIIDITLFVLSVVEIILILFFLKTTLHYFPEFIWLLVSGILMLISASSTDLFFRYGFTSPALHLASIIAILYKPLVLALYFWSQRPTISKEHVVLISVVFSILVLGIILPWTPVALKNTLFVFWQHTIALLFIYALYSLIRGIVKKQTGMLVLLAGAIIYLLTIRIEWLLPNPWGHYTILFGLLFFRYTMLISYFQRISQMSLDYKNLSQKMLTTIEDNKQSIARDLHDDLGQHLSAAKLHLLLCDDEKSKHAVHFIKTEIDASVQSMRDIMQGLHPIILEQYSIKEALQKEADRLSNLHSVLISLNTEDLTLAENIEKHLFRIFQETIINAISHGKATKIHVKIYTREQTLYFSAQDNGVGFKVLPSNDPKHGFGLVSLKERVGLMNGQMNTQSERNNGTTVNITVPLARLSQGD